MLRPVQRVDRVYPRRMREVVVFVGLQGAGKTTFFRERFAETHAHVSKDLFPNARRPEQRQRRLIADALEAGRPVVVDNTNASRAERQPVLDIARAHGARTVAYFFDEDVKACLERNARREGRARVPPVGVFAALKRLQRPTREEGFDEVFVVRLGEHGFELVG